MCLKFLTSFSCDVEENLFLYCFILCVCEWLTITQTTKLGAVARLEASSLSMQAAPSSIPHVRHILSWRLGHENISTAILPIPLIQEEQLSVTGERMSPKYWLTA